MFDFSISLLELDVLVLVGRHSLESLKRLAEHGHSLGTVHHHALSAFVDEESLQ